MEEYAYPRKNLEIEDKRELKGEVERKIKTKTENDQKANFKATSPIRPSKRVLREIDNCIREHEKEWDLKIIEFDDMGIISKPKNPLWSYVVSFRGLNAMKGTPFEDKRIRILISYPRMYPFASPLFRVLSPIFHPNVSSAGLLCNDKIHSHCPAEELKHMLLNIISLLVDPSLDDVENVQAASVFIEDRALYDAIARAHLEHEDD